MMTDLKLGDLVVLKSGGPVMTVDAVNTDIFDDSKFTGVVCVWFVGEQLQRARFDYRAVEPATSIAEPAAALTDPRAYADALASMVTEMNSAADPRPAAKAARRPARKAARDKPNRPSATHPGAGTA